jgi:Protein of unknown function (DUF2971)
MDVKPLPNYLYKYGSFEKKEESIERLKDILINHRVWFSSPSKLNDPFELRPAASFDLDSPGFREKYFKDMHALMRENGIHGYSKREKDIQEKYTELTSKKLTLRKQYRDYLANLGVYCLSENPDSLLMWAHYSYGHDGYRLKFDTTKWDENEITNADAITYQAEYPEIDVWKLVYESVKTRSHDPVANEAAGRKAVLIKSTEWTHEAEWRIISRAPGKFAFAPKSLIQIAFGCNTSQQTIEEVRTIIANRSEKIELIKMKLDEKNFKMHEGPIG